MEVKKRLFSYLKPLRARLVLALVFALLFVIAQLAQPFLLGKALDASSIHDVKLFDIYLIVSLSLAIGGVVFNYFFELLVMNTSQNVIKKMRDDLYLKINSIPLKDFDKHSHGDIVQLEIRDMENFASGVFAVFKTLMQGIFTVIITIIMMFMMNWILALGVMILSPLSVVMAKFVSRFSYKHYQKQNCLQADISSYTLEALNNLDIIQSLNHEDESFTKFKMMNDELNKEGKISQFSASWVNPSTRLVNNIIYVLIGIAGIIMLSFQNELVTVFAVMSIGRLSSFLSYTTQYSKPFNDISNVASEFETARASFKRINNFLNIEDDLDNGKEMINDIKSIEFKSIDFAYETSKPLFTDFNLKINKGDKVAIVGPTGAGKTSLINLLMRFYDPSKGEILVNDIPHTNVNKKSFRGNIGMVLQDTWIFKGTILDNIRYLKMDASIDEVKEAARKAHADVFINNLSKGYETIIDSKNSLSQGQMQMIAIARVMLLNPNMVILDEATSNIDTRSEMLITDAFDQMMKEKTSVVIAHRLSTIEHADKIIVMNLGKVIEIGNHMELMKKKGFYYSLYSSQYK